MASTNKDLDRSLTSNGYKPAGSSTYVRGNTTVHTDGSHWKKENGSWNNYDRDKKTW